MPQTKRSREASQDSSDDGTAASKRVKDVTHEGGTGLSHLAGFPRLPVELRSMIIELCIPSPSSSDSEASVRSGNLDLSPVAGLLTASRDLYAQVAPLVYPKLFADVIIDRPSGLALFHDAIVAKPWLRSLVKSLTITRKGWGSGVWPLSMVNLDKDGYGGQWRLCSGLTPDEKHSMPAWCCPEQEFSPADDQDDCATRCVLDAIDAAQDVFGFLDALPANGRRGSADRFIECVFNVQAALDLYLQEMRRIEDERGDKSPDATPTTERCLDLHCGHYPRLSVVRESYADSTARTQRASDEEVFVVTTAMVRAHLARPGALTDEFYHLLPMARSRRNHWFVDWKGRLVGSTEPMGVVGIDNAQANNFEADTFHGVIATLRSVLVRTKAPHIVFEEEEMDVLYEIVQHGWENPCLVEVGKEKPHRRLLRYIADNEEDTGCEAGKAVDDEGEQGWKTEE